MNPPLQTEWNKEYSTLDDYELDTDGTPIYVKTVAPDQYTQPNYLRIQSETHPTMGHASTLIRHVDYAPSTTPAPTSKKP